ncbi:MAG TPA: hypothetical protein VE951_07095 [Candidatus Angelobacter sp.]|jgi:hypothetical protein|nr:hypothetical protein [Candidatus Angelobacter sp.]
MTFRTIILDCACMTRANAGTIDAIARVHRDVRRHGMVLRLDNASGFLVALIDFFGLAEVLGVQPGWEAEQWKEPARIQEESDIGNLAF